MGWMDLMGDRSLGGKQFAALFGALALGVFGLTASLPANAQLGSKAGTGISQTKHNLGSGGANASAGTTEVCVFCHTPHAANTAGGPLWNRQMTTGQTILPYTSSTLLGGVALEVTKADAPGSVSLACLSCHDGVTATNTLINAPGSGGYAAGGAVFPALATELKITGVAAIGVDLRNDHPIGVKYAGGRAATAQVDGGYVEVKTGNIGGGSAFWVDTGADGTTPGNSADNNRQKTDMFLYARDVSGTSTPYVECASCHDPHTSNALFLRIPNDFSSVCLSCHIK